jgi:ubiquitin-protein ligase
MQSYQTVINAQNDSFNKLSYISNSIHKKPYIKSWNLSSELLELCCLYNKKTYSINIHHNNNRPSYIFAEIDNTNFFEKKLSHSLDATNLEIDNYERIEDIFYDLIQTFSTHAKDNVSTKQIISTKKKDIVEFIAQIESLKKTIKRSTIVSSVLSSESIIEMLGDQLIKLQMNKNYSVEIKDLQNFIIEMTNFNLQSGSNTDTSELKIFIVVKLPSDFISNPPIVSLKSNYVLKNNILNVIEKLKPFIDNTKWSIKYSIFETVENIYQMITKYGELDIVAKSELDKFLTELEYLLSIKNENISENKLLLEFDENLANELAGFINNKSTQKTYWKAGTGYGHDGSSTWNIDEYAKIVKHKKNKIAEKINELFVKLDNTTDLEVSDIEKLKSIFKYYMLDDELDVKIVTNIASVISNHNSQFNDKIFVSSVIKSIKDFLEDNNIKHPITEIVENIDLPLTNLDDFQTMFNEYKFKYFEGDFKTFHYKKVLDVSSNQVSRLQKEFQILKKSITLNKEASIFFCIQKNNVNKIKFMISGPKNTPYEYGLLIFDMTMSTAFPSTPPLVNLSNTGGKRFNPNLYNCGKVCLSLLGTWRGDKGESWNINTSTFNQLIISIQSQILVDEPFFNEPGHERTIGTQLGINESKKYNDTIKQYTLDHAMCGLLSGDQYPEFKDIIHKYFKYHKNSIIKTLDKWLVEMPPENKNKFQKSYDEFNTLVNKL